MFRQLDRSEIKAEARALLRSGTVSPLRMTLFFLAIQLLLDLIDTGASFMLSGSVATIDLSDPYALSTLLAGFGSFAFFVSILIALITTVLWAGYTCYCFGIHRREHMPYESLFDAFSFAGRVILLEIVQTVFIVLWSLLFIVPGIIAMYRYSFAVMNLCENPDLGVMEALRLSKQQTVGYKWQLFVLHLSFIGWYLLGGLVASLYELCLAPLMPNTFFGALIGAALYALFAAVVDVYLTPYVQLSECGFYLRATEPIVTAPPHYGDDAQF